ncbi:MAG: hypothetical protein HN380_29160, partial [Victivallales bacterium]|nr:hypothetical protein [Victivallales bacterium]
MGINYRTGAWAPAISLLAAVFLYLPAGGGRAVAADFESIKFEVVNRAVPDGKGGSLEIKADGTCTYHGERRPPFRRAADPWPAKTYTHTLSDARMARLRALIAETKWLEIPPGERTSFSSHDGTTT